MTSAAKPVYSVQVRELVEFALRRGDLGGERAFVGPGRALAGTRGHQRVQKSRPAGYQKEVPVLHEVETDELILRIQGRIDGLLVTPEEMILEEIKTVQGAWNHLADPLHWAQAKVYAFIYAHDQGLEEIVIRLAYLELETGKVTEFQEDFSRTGLAAFFEAAMAIYLEWIRERHRWCLKRDQSIRLLDFPFPRYRSGQRELAVAAYRTLARGGRLFLEAPTGIGKTMSVLYPALKALAEGKLERIFYLTARTVGRTVAEKALADLRQAGLRLHTVTLTAKEKICVREGVRCDPGTCPLAIGYYDRCKAAMRAALGCEGITRSVLEAVGQEHQVCPFELSLDLSSWVDAIVCDYNYVFDPKVYLRRHFGEEARDYGFLVDEAHNLGDRAREMFSAELHGDEILEVRRAIRKALPRCARSLTRLISAMRKLCGPARLPPEPVEYEDAARELDLFGSEMRVAGTGATGAVTTPSALPLDRSAELRFGAVLLGEASSNTPKRNSALRSIGGTHGRISREGLPRHPNPAQTPSGNETVLTTRELPEELLPLLDDALKEAETWLAQNQPAEFRENLLELYFRLHSFRRTAELYDERYVTIIEPGSAGVRLYCLDPSYLLRQALERGTAAVFFSATLTPIDYYRSLLGGGVEDPLLQLPSPFAPENLAVLVHDRIRTNFKARAETLAEVVDAVGALVQGRSGNYLVYLPSYQYLAKVQEHFQALYPTVRVLVQRPGLGEAERESFLAAFAAEHGETLVGFAVMGGMFGEGIDLVGDRLIGAVIVGVGLPQLCVERDLIRDYFQEKNGAGFDYAYTFPGMNRVLQATGRVIRSETDRGVVLLIDTRFAEQRYRRLFPSWWEPVRVRNVSEIRETVRNFWHEPA